MNVAVDRREEQDILDVLHRMSVCVLAGDWRGFRAMMRPQMISVADDRTVTHDALDDYARGFETISLRARSAGWDGVRIELKSVEAVGRACVASVFDVRPMTGDTPFPIAAREAVLLQRDGSEMSAVAVLNPFSEACWISPDAPRPRAGRASEETPAAVAAVQGMQQALQTGDLPGFLATTDQPFVIAYEGGVTSVRNAGEASRLLASYQHAAARAPRYTSEPLELRRLGRSLMVGRFRINAVSRDGSARDPVTNFYVLRYDRTGWRVAMSFNTAIGETLPPPPPLGRKDP